MGKSTSKSVTMRVRIGESEVEVSGPSDFVEKKIAEFLDAHKGPLARLAPTQAGTDQQTAESAPRKPMGVAQFFKKVGARTDVDRALAGGYYLEKFKREDSFTAAEVRETIRKAKIRPPKNPNDAIAKNVKKGFMMSAGEKDGKNAIVLTSDGEDAVRERLSD